MKNKLLLFLFHFCFLMGAQAQDVELKIIVIDEVESERIEFANVYISPCECGGPTNEDGELNIDLPKKEYQVITSCVGFQTDTSFISLEKKSKLIVSLKSESFQLENITVIGQGTQENIERTTMGVQQLSAEKMKMLPTAIGEVDILRSMTMLAGVGSAGEASNGLSIRGGSLDQNLVLLDRAPIFNPTHLFGLFSVFTPEAVGGVELYRANMPAKYGGRISSVVDVKVKNPDAEKLTLTGGIGFASSRFSVETPIIENKLTLLASTRFFFNDFLFTRIERLKNTEANFWDSTVKLKFNPNEKNIFFLTGFVSNDFYQLDITSRINSITATSNQYKYLTLNGTLNWLHTFDNNSNLRTTLVNSNYRPQILFPQEGSSSVINYDSKIQYRSLQSEYFKSLNSFWSYYAGVQVDQTTLAPGSLFTDNVEGLEQVELAEENNFEISAFTNVDWTPTDKLAVSLGLRFTQYLLMGAHEEAIYDDDEKENLIDVINYPSGEVAQSYNGLEPRLGMRWKISNNTSLKASYSLTRQYLQNIYNSTTPLPTSRWKMSDAHIGPQTGKTYSLGIYRNVKNNKIALSAEGYYRTIDNVLGYKPGADFFLQKFIEQDVLQGEARTYGLEFNFERPEGTVNGWFNYTWSRSLQRFEAEQANNRINNNEWFRSDFDRPHVFNGTLNYKLNDFNTWSFNFTYQTGRPYSIPNATFLIDNIPVPVFLERNNARLPAYHRLDFSWRIHNISTKKEKRWKGDWILTVYNLYNRKNAFNRYFGGLQNGRFGRVFGGGPLGAYQVSIFNSTVVSLTYSFKFS